MSEPRPNHPSPAAAISRRGFLAGVSAAGAGFWTFPRCDASEAPASPHERLRIAGIGLGAIGSENLAACAGHDVVALCDVDERMASPTFRRYPRARRYRDFRRLLDRERDLDAVIVATPDHTHAVITAAAMRSGRHVYTQMPLAHDVAEARELVRIARETGVATQMGNERYSGPTIRTTCEWIRGGAVGAVREVHCWTHHPRWPQGRLRSVGSQRTPPPTLDWDLWIGPAPERAWDPAYHPYRWRSWRDFGTGALGALGCHELDGAYWALRLGEARAFTIEAESVGGSEALHPRRSTVRYRFPARGDQAPVTVTWYDGGCRPPRPAGWPDTRELLGSGGTLLVGDEGTLVFGAATAGTNPGQAGPRFVPESRRASYRPPRRSIPRIRGEGQWVEPHRHVQDWLRACRGERPACSRFEVSGPLTEIVLLGNVALASGRRIEWDAPSMAVKGDPDAQRRIRREYRAGWSL